MAKTDSFFIRAKTDYNGSTFTQSSIDLGAYVDALGKSVLRIHNIAVQFGTPLDAIAPPTALSAVNSFQLTTQSQTSMTDVTNKSVIASGKLSAISGNSGVTTPFITEALDIAPQMWTSGYLVGVEQIYLGVDSTASANLGIGQCGIILECTVETLSSSAAMALALSQQ